MITKVQYLEALEICKAYKEQLENELKQVNNDLYEAEIRDGNTLLRNLGDEGHFVIYTLEKATYLMNFEKHVYDFTLNDASKINKNDLKKVRNVCASSIFRIEQLLKTANLKLS